MLFGGAFSDGVIQVAGTVCAALIIVGVGALVRFLWNVRDTLRDQHHTLNAIDKAVNHTPEGEPRLYDLVVDAAKDSREALQQVRVLKGTVTHMQTQNSRRDVEWSDAIIDLRGEVAKVQTTLESLTPE
jgi:hypothetical protein